MHRAPSPTADQPPGGGDCGRRTPQSKPKLVGKGKRWGVERGGAGLGKGVRRAEVAERTRGKRYGGGGWRQMENGVSSNYGALGAGWDLMNLDIKEYYLIFFRLLCGHDLGCEPSQRMWGPPAPGEALEL